MTCNLVRLMPALRTSESLPPAVRRPQSVNIVDEVSGRHITSARIKADDPWDGLAAFTWLRERGYAPVVGSNGLWWRPGVSHPKLSRVMLLSAMAALALLAGFYIGFNLPV